jgi:hypothetical protein
MRIHRPGHERRYTDADGRVVTEYAQDSWQVAVRFAVVLGNTPPPGARPGCACASCMRAWSVHHSATPGT